MPSSTAVATRTATSAQSRQTRTGAAAALGSFRSDLTTLLITAPA
jgi:hypothetical protein